MLLTIPAGQSIIGPESVGLKRVREITIRARRLPGWPDTDQSVLQMAIEVAETKAGPWERACSSAKIPGRSRVDPSQTLKCGKPLQRGIWVRAVFEATFPLPSEVELTWRS